MFGFAILVGIYSYTLFAVGIFGILDSYVILYITAVFVALSLIWTRTYLFTQSVLLKRYLVTTLRKTAKDPKKDLLPLFLLVLISAQAVVNMIGVFGPEIGFDALWYHLTLPKLYLDWGVVKHIPGGILYYSDMPKLVEMLYAGGLSLSNENVAKAIHFVFGLLTTVVVYQFAREMMDRKFSLLASALFYANLVVGWESTSAYVDLGRAFFEILALYALYLWVKTKKKLWFIESAVMLGLAITTKLLALSSLAIFMVMIIIIWRQSKMSMRQLVVLLGEYLCMSLLIPLPWFLFSYLNTGNIVYPFFTKIYPVGEGVGGPITILHALFTLLTSSADPINPIYILVLPLFFVVRKRVTNDTMLLFLYSFFGLLVWSLLPKTGGGRFILPYLPAFSVATSLILSKLRTSKETLNRQISFFLMTVSIVIIISSLFYRGAANAKYVPVLLGKEAKGAFLMKHLNFSFADFYDTDGYFKKTIKNNDVVLLYGFHNLYYVDFPFIDSSWVKPGDRFNYIAVQRSEIPDRFKNWNRVYYNKKTDVGLYTVGGPWIY